MVNYLKCGNGCYKAEPLQGLACIDEGTFELKAVGFIIQKVFFNIKTKTVFLKCIQTGYIITCYIPFFLTFFVISQSKVNRSVFFPCKYRVMNKNSLLGNLGYSSST